ncbi:zinc finger protein 862-like isoform X2 [Saccostrea cucullata]|uniref:zinc finger protein 862-like isoform X2 n=1 Tax=Saccostrea cuccullata TaxID=36930 RepID=UPI002ED65AAD
MTTTSHLQLFFLTFCLSSTSCHKYFSGKKVAWQIYTGLSTPVFPHSTDFLRYFGDEHIKTAADHFQQDLETAGLDADDVFHEWVFLKSDIYGSFPDVHELSWPQVQRQLNGYENIFGLIDLLLTLPSSSSECERGFSQMKKIKTDSRTRLTEASLDDLLTVSLHSDAIDKFDPIPAINKWVHGAVAKRRPQFNDKKRKQQTQGQQEREKRQRTEETIEIIDAETQSESVERESQSEDVEGESESAEGERTLEDSRGDNEEETDEEMNGEIDEDEGSEIDSENDLSEERVNEIILNFEKEIEREMQ